jgi:hypothetical protein
MPAIREPETAFSIGVCSFNLRLMSDELRREVERRLSGLPIEYSRLTVRSRDGQMRRQIVWHLRGEDSPTYTQSDLQVME